MEGKAYLPLEGSTRRMLQRDCTLPDCLILERHPEVATPNWYRRTIGHVFSIPDWYLKLMGHVFSIPDWYLKLMGHVFSIPDWYLKLMGHVFSIPDWYVRIIGPASILRNECIGRRKVVDSVERAVRFYIVVSYQTAILYPCHDRPIPPPCGWDPELIASDASRCGASPSRPLPGKAWPRDEE